MPTCHLKLLKSGTNSPNSQGPVQSGRSKITAFLRVQHLSGDPSLSGSDSRFTALTTLHGLPRADCSVAACSTSKQ